MTYTYTAIFTPRIEGGFEVRIPDLPHCVTSGQDLVEAMKMIQDAASLMLMAMEDEEIAVPAAQSPLQMEIPEGSFESIVILNTDQYRREIETKPVRKSVSIPLWMDKQARQRGISCSQVLQDGLRRILA